MKIEGYDCDHPTVAGKPCAICATHYGRMGDANPSLSDISTGQLFNELVRRLNYDGPDTSSLTLGEIARAVDGASLPQS